MQKNALWGLVLGGFCTLLVSGCTTSLSPPKPVSARGYASALLHLSPNTTEHTQTLALAAISHHEECTKTLQNPTQDPKQARASCTEALRHYDTFIHLYPKHPRIGAMTLARGQAAEFVHGDGDALQTYNRALSHCNQDRQVCAQVYTHMALIHMRNMRAQETYEAAQNATQHTQRSDPFWSVAQYAKAWSLFVLQKRDEAQHAISELTSLQHRDTLPKGSYPSALEAAAFFASREGNSEALQSSLQRMVPDEKDRLSVWIRALEIKEESGETAFLLSELPRLERALPSKPQTDQEHIQTWDAQLLHARLIVDIEPHATTPLRMVHHVLSEEASLQRPPSPTLTKHRTKTLNVAVKLALDAWALRKKTKVEPIGWWPATRDVLWLWSMHTEDRKEGLFVSIAISQEACSRNESQSAVEHLGQAWERAKSQSTPQLRDDLLWTLAWCGMRDTKDPRHVGRVLIPALAVVRDIQSTTKRYGHPPEVWEDLAHGLVDAGVYREAAELLGEVLEFNPDHTLGPLFVARYLESLYQLGDFESAVRVLGWIESRPILGTHPDTKKWIDAIEEEQNPEPSDPPYPYTPEERREEGLE